MEVDAGEGGDESDDSVKEYDSDQLESPHSNSDDRIVYSTHMDVTKKVPFDPIDMNNPTLIVSNAFHDATKFRKVVRQYNIIRG
jgi:hypothetical protein